MIWEATVFQKEKFSVLRNTAHLTRHWASLFIPLHWKGMVLESSSSPQSHSTPEAPGRLWIPSLSGRWCKASHLGWVQNPLQRHSAHEIPVRTLLCSGAVCPTKEKPSDLQPCRSGATPEHPVQGLWNAEGRCYIGFAPTSLTKRLWAFFRASSGTVDWTVLLCRLMTEICRKKENTFPAQAPSSGLDIHFK